MKNFVFATVSIVALTLACAANAQDTSNAPATEAPATEAPATEAPAVEAPAAEATAPGKLMEMKPAPMKHKAERPVAPHHRHHKHHYKHHAEVYHPVEVQGVYVTFPPLDECGRPACAPSYYAGNQGCPYQYHGGYFWYPHAQGTLLEGYAPYHYQGRYWYASHMHPHMVYTQKVQPVPTYPYPLAHPRDAAAYSGQQMPMQPKWESAPKTMPAEEY